MATTTLSAFLERARAEVDEALERWLPKPPDCPAIVADAMRYSVFAGGKRLRPCLTLAAAEAIGRAKALPHTAVSQGAPGPQGPAALALPAACAIEMLHTYSLIHDDLPAMDDDTLRRGRPTSHVVFGEGIAILAGDGLHAEAFTLLAREPADDGGEISRRKLEVLRVIGTAAGPAGMVGGQAIDLQAAGQTPGARIALDADALQKMHARKTGALIRAAAVSGAVMSGGVPQQIAAVDAFAIEVGLAFQIVDDILDVEGDAATLGKSAGKDAAGDKPTYPSLFGLERSRQLARDCLARAHQALRDGGLADSQLPAIADWVVTRKN